MNQENMTRVSLNNTKPKLQIWEKNEVQNKRENTKINMEKRMRKNSAENSSHK